MALAKVWKVVSAADESRFPGGVDNLTPAKQMLAEVRLRWGGQVRLAVTKDYTDWFLAVTDCSWQRLGLAAWSTGHPGISYVLRLTDFDEEDAEQFFREFLEAEQAQQSTPGEET